MKIIIFWANKPSNTPTTITGLKKKSKFVQDILKCEAFDQVYGFDNLQIKNEFSLINTKYADTIVISEEESDKEQDAPSN